MIKHEQVIVIDIDGTLCGEPQEKGNYLTAMPFYPMINKLKQLKEAGFHIILQSSRQMRTYNGNVGLIAANTLPTLCEWLKKYDIPFDEIHLGRPWCGHDGYYVDNRAIRPSEFCQLNHQEILNLLDNEAQLIKELK